MSFSVLSKIPFEILKRAWDLKRSYYVRRNYRVFLESGKPAIVGDLPCDFEVVHQEFVSAGFPPEDYFVDISAFNEYLKLTNKEYESYRAPYKELFTEKALEHFVSLCLLSIPRDTRIIDIANAGSPFPDIVHKLYGCNAHSNDLIFPKGIRRFDWHTKIGGDACNMPVPDESFDCAVMHCALEMFEGDSDIRLMEEVQRILKPGGKLVVIPLYVNERYHILRDLKTHWRKLPEIDEGAELVYRQDFHGLAFARFYSIEAFVARLVRGFPMLDLTVFRVRNATDVHPKNYLLWIAVFEKRAKP